MTPPKTIAIDGPAASGKSTLGELLAEHLGYLYLDTGNMYRAVTLAALQTLGAVDNEVLVTDLARKIDIDVREPSVQDGRQADVLLDGRDITWAVRAPEVDANVSVVAAYGGVRTAMVAQQRRIGERGGVVMVGRDIGTVVLPNADLKIYMDASVEERARRRYTEVHQRGEETSYEEILASMRRRDQLDSTRANSPLRVADDAVVIQTDGMAIDEVFQRIIASFEPHRSF